MKNGTVGSVNLADVFPPGSEGIFNNYQNSAWYQALSAREKALVDNAVARLQGAVDTSTVNYSLNKKMADPWNMEFVGGRLSMRLGGLPTVLAAVSLLLAYVLLHYLFVSQTSHLLALFGVFLGVGVTLGVSPALLAFQLLFATNYFAAITPQASSANLLFAGSGYLSQQDLYRLGILHTGLCVLIYLVIGTPWLLLVTR